MWKTFVVSSVCFLMAACSQQGTNSGEGTSAQNENGTSIKQEKNNIENAAKQAEKQVKEAAAAQKDKIEAEAKAAKAKIEAEQASAKVEVKSKQKDLDQATQKIHDAVGSAQQSISGTTTDKNQLVDQAKDAVKNDPGVQVSVDNGTVTLNGTVDTQAEKTSIEQKIKSLNGVQDVKNDLDVKNK